MRHYLFSFCSIFLFLLPSAFAQQNTGRIKVKVLDASDHKPVSWAQVTTQFQVKGRGNYFYDTWRYAHTDRQNPFAILKDLPPGSNYEITISPSEKYIERVQPHIAVYPGRTTEITIYVYRTPGMWNNNNQRAIMKPPPPPRPYDDEDDTDDEGD
jgi:hypothetical protein